MMSEQRAGYTTLDAHALTDWPAVAGGTSTLSKSPFLFPQNAPRPLVRARGSRVLGSDGREYVDWIAGLLAVLLGYRNREVEEAVEDHLRTGGPTWSLPHALEERVAGTIRRLAGFPQGQVRFVKTGSEACGAAVRIARAITGREEVASAGYHGWHDACLTTPPAWGVPAQPAVTVPYGTLGEIGDAMRMFKLAAVIVEPVTTQEPPPGYLQGLRDLCTEHDALLIFDECITGSRYPEFIAGRHYGVQPDLTVLSKGLANGYALACVVGEREHLRCFDVDWRPAWASSGASGPVYVSGTWSTETVGLAAAAATLHVWERDHVAEQLWRTGTRLREHLAAAVEARGLSSRVRLVGPPYRTLLDVVDAWGRTDLAARTLVLQELCARGVLVGSGFNVMAAHSLEDSARTVDAWAPALDALVDADAKGDVLARIGRPIQSPYRQT